MKKILLAATFLMSFSLNSHATILATDITTITELFTYDDYSGGVVIVNLAYALPACPNGGYLNPASVGFKSLYTSALLAFAMGKNVRFQLYDDRILATRCEIDNITVYK